MSASVVDSSRTSTSDVLRVPRDHVAHHTSPATIDNCDSVQHLNLVLAIEQAFSVMFEPEELDQMKSVGEIVAIVERKRRESA